jgi:hypothetical protein
MQVAKRRVHVFVEALHVAEAERLAALRKRSMSDTLAYLIGRGLEREAHTELVQLTSAVEALGEQLERLQEQTEYQETRESERYRRLLGHLQVNQALGAEAVACQRVKMLEDRPRDYDKAVDLARRQTTEDAGMYRESLAIGGPAQPRKSGKQGERAA